MSKCLWWGPSDLQFLLEVSPSASLCFSILLSMPPALFSFLSFLPKKTWKDPKMSENSLSGICSALFCMWCNPKKTIGSIRTHSLTSDDLSLISEGLFNNLSLQNTAQSCAVKAVSFSPRFLYNLIISFLSRGKSNFVWISVIYADKYHQFSGFENHPVICWAEKTAVQSLYTDNFIITIWQELYQYAQFTPLRAFIHL